MKYLTVAHTHLTADCIHTNIESKIRQIKTMYCFGDAKNTIKCSRKNVDINLTYFYEWENKIRMINIKTDPLHNFKISNNVMANFPKNSILWNIELIFDDKLQVLGFIQNRFCKTEIYLW